MIVTAGLILGATLFAWTAPTVLRRITAVGNNPTTAIRYRMVSLAAVLGTYGLGVLLVLLPGD